MNVSRISLSVDTSCGCVTSDVRLYIDRSNRTQDWLSTALGRIGIESIRGAFQGTSFPPMIGAMRLVQSIRVREQSGTYFTVQGTTLEV